MAGLHIDWSAMELVEVQILDGLGGCLAVIHVNEGVVLDDGTLCDCAILGEECLDFLLVCLPGEVSYKNFHHLFRDQSGKNRIYKEVGRENKWLN